MSCCCGGVKNYVAGQHQQVDKHPTCLSTSSVRQNRTGIIGNSRHRRAVVQLPRCWFVSVLAGLIQHGKHGRFVLARKPFVERCRRVGTERGRVVGRTGAASPAACTSCGFVELRQLTAQHLRLLRLISAVVVVGRANGLHRQIERRRRRRRHRDVTSRACAHVRSRSTSGVDHAPLKLGCRHND